MTTQIVTKFVSKNCGHDNWHQMIYIQNGLVRRVSDTRFCSEVEHH